MATLPETVLSPQSWVIITVVGLLGAVIGLCGGRLVRLFGPVHERTIPGPRECARTGNEHVVPLPFDDAMYPTADPEEASHNHELSSGTDQAPPPPRCPHCMTSLIFPAWMLIVTARRSTCPYCGYLVHTHVGTIIITAVLFVLVGACLHPRPLPELLPLLWLVAVGVPLAMIDLRVTRLPNTLVGLAYPIAGIFLVAATYWPRTEPRPDRVGAALVGMVLTAVLYWLLWRLHPKGMGFGDVKLSGLTGLYTAWLAGVPGALTASFWAFSTFSLVGLVLLALRRISRRQPFPLGPFMLGATFVTVLVGEPLLPEM